MSEALVVGIFMTRHDCSPQLALYARTRSDAQVARMVAAASLLLRSVVFICAAEQEQKYAVSVAFR